MTFGALPESGRPSDGAISAVVYTLLAEISGPGRLYHRPLNVTSIFGMLYVAITLPSVRKLSFSSQYGAVRSAASGSVAMTAQLSVSCRPVLTPPCTVNPRRNRR